MNLTVRILVLDIIFRKTEVWFGPKKDVFESTHLESSQQHSWCKKAAVLQDPTVTFLTTSYMCWVASQHQGKVTFWRTAPNSFCLFRAEGVIRARESQKPQQQQKGMVLLRSCSSRSTKSHSKLWLWHTTINKARRHSRALWQVFGRGARMWQHRELALLW